MKSDAIFQPPKIEEEPRYFLPGRCLDDDMPPIYAPTRNPCRCVLEKSAEIAVTGDDNTHFWLSYQLDFHGQASMRERGRMPFIFRFMTECTGTFRRPRPSIKDARRAP